MNGQTPSPTLVPRPRGLATAYDEHRHAILFYSLLLTMVSAPLLAALEFGGFGLRLMLAVNLMASVLGLRRGRGRSVLLMVTAAAVGTQMLPPSLFAAGLPAAGLVFWSGIALFTAAASALFVLRAAVVETEHVYAAMSVYLLAGIFFGVLHWTIEQVWPGSYVPLAGRLGALRLFDGIYFSFVTLTTVGYGDIVPASDVARGLSITESVSGQLYLAVMIARLVGSHLQNRNQRPRA